MLDYYLFICANIPSASDFIMKRNVFVLLCASFLVACSNQKYESQEVLIEPQCTEEFNAVLNNIASLNDTFGCDELSTRSDIRGFFYQVADYAGSYLGARLGLEIGRAVSEGTTVIVGALVGSAVGMLASIAGSVAASKLFDILWPADEGGGYSVTQPSNFGVFTSSLYVGSSGSVHNQILNAIENNGKDYFDEDGNVLVEELFYDALEYEENLVGASYNADYINEMELFCKDLYATIRDAKSQGLSESQVCDEIYGLLRVKGCSDNDVRQLKALSNALLPSVSLEAEEVPTYELEFNNIIESSGLDEREKACLATAGSVYIHSVQYWY